ncbi:hypothetical protein [Pseudoalteromonas lipolytica]|uniref:hypothetical protein n=1 Tax=Pseudoalteromonas lipolytica TaxID=570156 RepID=UPI000824D72E|nr:hypothetical protein [Pseudoalteromonas lipolytica]
MTKIISLTLLTLLLTACQPTPNASANNNKPDIDNIKSAPSNMQANITVQGHTSTLNNMDIEFLGKTIPYTYSDGKIGNSRGYNWWVSKHFALKSDLPKEKVTLYLELLEMAYPHYVALFGMAPPNIERQRIAVVYGSSRSRVREAMLDDGFLRGVHKTAGGETMFYNRAGYNFPSHREHHQRYIVIHETMHAFHMALNGHSTWAPNWITEGLADSIAHHVYDPEHKQLTVMVFDRAPMNYIETGLKQYYSANKPTIEEINDDPALKRGLNFFIIHYLLSSPERAQYFADFIEELRLANPHSEATLSTANSLLKSTFKNWSEIEQGFADFVENIQPSFHIVSGPWEQDGNAYWLRNTQSTALSRLDINPPSAANHPVMDFPAPKPSSLIDVANKNQVAALIEFEAAQLHRGKIGIALQGKRNQKNQKYRRTFVGEEQASDDQLLMLVVEDSSHLIINVQNYDNFKTKQIALTPEIKDALIADKKLAINLTLEQAQLRVNLHAQRGSKKVTQQFSIPLNKQMISTLNSEKISLLGQNNNHKITPYLFNPTPTRLVSVTAENALTNPWLFKNYALLNRVFKTCQQHERFIPQCDLELSNILAKLPSIELHDEASSELEFLENQYITTLNNTGFSTLSGVKSDIYYHQQKPFLRVVNPTGSSLEITAQVSLIDSADKLIKTHQLKRNLTSGTHNISLLTEINADKITIAQTLKWKSLTHQTTLSKRVTPFNGVEFNVVKTKEHEDHWLVAFNLSGPYSGETTGDIILTSTLFEQATPAKSQQKSVDIAPYEQKTYTFKVTKTDKPKQISVKAILNVDGEPIRLIQELTLS